jgi:tetratricopeptide (TPR) repeat protein
LLVLGQGQPNPALRQEAIERYRQLLQASQTPSLLQEAAAALASQPQTQGEALELYDQLLAIAPAQGGEIPLQRLLLAYQLGRVNASQLPELLQAQLANLPDGADRQRVALALRGLAGVKFSQGEYGEAARLYQQVLAVRPGDFDTLQALADLHLAQDHPLAALQQLQANFQQLRGKSEAVTPQVQQLSDRIVEVKVERLKRRGFQPAWERY